MGKDGDPGGQARARAAEPPRARGGGDGAAAGTDPALWPSLMKAAQDGDQQAYRRLLGEIVPSVRALARRRIADAVLVEDVVQDVLLTVHRVRHTYDPARPFKPWIAAIAGARTVDALRRQGRTHRREVGDGEMLEQAIDPAPARQAEMLAAESELGRLLGLLPHRQREAVELVKLREMSLDEAAHASSLSVPALKALLHRALARLRKYGSVDDGRP